MTDILKIVKTRIEQHGIQLKNRGSKKELAPKINFKGVNIINPSHIAEIFNEYFSSEGLRIQQGKQVVQTLPKASSNKHSVSV